MKTLLVALLLTFSVSAHAQETEITWLAKAYYEFGEGYFAQQNYVEALVNFKTAYSILPVPEYAYDIALAHWKMDNIYAARDWLRIYSRNKLTAAEIDRGNKLTAILIPLIDEDYSASGLTFSCARMETKLQHCGIHKWSKDELAAYQIWERKQ